MRGIIEPLNFIQPQLGHMDGFSPHGTVWDLHGEEPNLYGVVDPENPG